jgi:hypothetical protein
LRSSTKDKCILTRVWNWSGSSLLSRSAKTLSLFVSIDSGTLQFSVLLGVAECTFVRLQIHTHDDYILKENTFLCLRLTRIQGYHLMYQDKKQRFRTQIATQMT